MQHVLGVCLSVLYKIAPQLGFAAVSKVVLHEETLELTEPLATYRHWLRPNAVGELLGTGDPVVNEKKPTLWPVSSTGLLGDMTLLERLVFRRDGV